MYQTTHNGIVFIEGRPEHCDELGEVCVAIDGFITQAQLKTLSDVKDLMAQKVRSAGGNAVVNFSYGQKSVGFWKSLLSLDDVAWYGNGIMATIPTD